MLSVRRLWQRQEQKALFLAADPAAQYFHQYFKWLFCSKFVFLPHSLIPYSCMTRITSPSWYSWPSWGFFTLTQGLDNDFLVWLFRIKHPVYGYILHIGNVWESTWSIFLTYTWVWWHCLWTRGWERHRPIRMETGHRKVILPLSLGDRLRVTLALKAWFSFNSIA